MFWFSKRCRTHHPLCNLIAFPQNTPNFHKNRAFNHLVSKAIERYLSTHRRSNPPEGERRQEPSEIWKRSSQERRERISRRTGSGTRKGTGKELRMRIGNEVRKTTGNGNRKSIGDETRKGIGEEARKGIRNESHASTQETDCSGWNKKALAAKCDDGVRETVGSARTSRKTST